METVLFNAKKYFSFYSSHYWVEIYAIIQNEIAVILVIPHQHDLLSFGFGLCTRLSATASSASVGAAFEADEECGDQHSKEEAEDI